MKSEMFAHEKIMNAIATLQRDTGMTKTECVAETAQAIHVMLTFAEQDIGAMLDAIRKPKLKKRVASNEKSGL